MNIFTIIDDRFIHGRIIVGWVPKIRCQQIIVANDRVALNDLQKKLMRVATPEEIGVFFLNLKEAADSIKEGKFEAVMTLLLIGNPKDALRLVQQGVHLESIILVGMHYTPDRKQIFPAISMNEEEIETCRQLVNYGIKIEVRDSPDAPKANLFDHIK